MGYALPLSHRCALGDLYMWYRGVPTCAHTCKGHRLTPCLLCCSPPYFWRQGFFLNLRSLFQLDCWPALDLPVSVPSPHSCAGVRGECSQAWIVTWVLGIQTQVPMLYGKHFTYGAVSLALSILSFCYCSCYCSCFCWFGLKQAGPNTTFLAEPPKGWALRSPSPCRACVFIFSLC